VTSSKCIFVHWIKISLKVGLQVKLLMLNIEKIYQLPVNIKKQLYVQKFPESNGVILSILDPFISANIRPRVLMLFYMFPYSFRNFA